MSEECIPCEERIDYEFLTEEAYFRKAKKGAANCLVKVKLFEGQAQEDFERNIYLEFIKASDETQVKTCVNRVVKEFFPYIRSCRIEVYIKPPQADAV